MGMKKPIVDVIFTVFMDCCETTRFSAKPKLKPQDNLMLQKLTFTQVCLPLPRRFIFLLQLLEILSLPM